MILNIEWNYPLSHVQPLVISWTSSLHDFWFCTASLNFNIYWQHLQKFYGKVLKLSWIRIVQSCPFISVQFWILKMMSHIIWICKVSQLTLLFQSTYMQSTVKYCIGKYCIVFSILQILYSQLPYFD